MDNRLLVLLERFLDRDPVARQLCRAYGEDHKGAFGYLWQRLTPEFGEHVRNPTAWVRKYARWHLQNYLRRECCQRV